MGAAHLPPLCVSSVCQGSGPTGCRQDLLSCSLTVPKCGHFHPLSGLGAPLCVVSLCLATKCYAGSKEEFHLVTTKLHCRLSDSLMGDLKLCQVTHFLFFLNRLVGDILLCTGFLSYLGPFNQIFRNLLLKDQWEIELRARKIPFTENLNLISMLVDPPTVSITFLIVLPWFSVLFYFLLTKKSRYTYFLFFFHLIRKVILKMLKSSKNEFSLLYKRPFAFLEILLS